MSFFARKLLRSAPRLTATFRAMSTANAPRPKAILFTSAFIGGAGTYYMIGSDSIEASSGLPDIGDELRAQMESLADEVKQHVQMPVAAKQVIWNAIRMDIEAILEDEQAKNPGKDGFPGNSGGGGAIGPMFVRLAWHCSGTYCKGAKNGGSEGATMRFSPEADHGGNAGLHHARALLEPVYQKYKHLGVTYADLYIFSGNASIEYMAGPELHFRPGRMDANGTAKPCPGSVHSPDGRLPDADGRGKFPGDHIRDIFYRMGFNDREIVALSGAHGLGHCHTDRSGFWGPWTYAPTTFSNEFYRLLLEEKWSIKKTHKSKKWEGPEQYENEKGDLMMLPTDCALVQDPKFKEFVVEYCKDEDVFFQDFAAAWTKLTENGCNDLSADPIINFDRRLEKIEDIQEAVQKKLSAISAQISAGTVEAKKSGWWPF